MKNIIKKIFNKKILKIFFVIYALLSILAVVFFADHLLTDELDLTNDRMYFNDNWTVTINSECYENVNLSDFKFPSVDKGTCILLEKQLPDDWKFEIPALTFGVRQTTVKMYSDWKLFYSYGHDRLAEGKTVGSGLQTINFSNEYKGTTLKILLTVTENDAFSTFDSIYISEWSDATRIIVTENRLAFYTGTFLVVFGVAVATITVFATIYSKKYARILWLSAFSIFIGFWTLCYHNVINIFSIPTYSASLLEYMMLLICPIPILGYLFTYVKQFNSKPVFSIYKALFILQIITTIVTIALHTADIIHAAALLPATQILLSLHSLFFAFVFIVGQKRIKTINKVHSFGLLLVLFCIIYDLIIYALNRYTGMHISFIKGVSSIGIIIFIGILVLDIVQDISFRLMEEHEKERLIKCAYTDSLTQINNRTFCTEYMLALDSKKSNNYTIFSFDLNNLKTINDTFGHAQGDHLIKTAANVISKTFSHSGIVGRMGGDEFIAIIPTTNTEIINKLIKQFHFLIETENEEDSHLHLSISYGYAHNTEIEDNKLVKVYELADKRMYDNKKQTKRR